VSRAPICEKHGVRCHSGAWFALKQAICDECSSEQRFEILLAVANDRDEWREQHENLLFMYRQAIVEIAALKSPPPSAPREPKRD
jgi:hypothetical protein